MNYPSWDVPGIGAGLVVAIIATIHILISHFAIGGGAFLFVAEIWSDRQPDGEKIRAWLHKFATFFLVYTTVFGAMTGVGIWFAIQLASPEATSLLIHQFVFAWAIEWVMFLGELSLLYLYYYGWNRNSRRMQVWLSGLYFFIAWMSLFVINGILTFMLTSGDWTLAEPDILAGFFNPGYWPSLVLRTVVMFLVAGLGALLVASLIRDDDDLKERVVVFATRWVLPGALLAPPMLYWLGTTLPQNSVDLLAGGVTGIGGGRMEVISIFFGSAIVAGALLIIANFVYHWKPRALTFSAAMAMFLTAQLGIVGGEFTREMARKPYVLHGSLFSNNLWQDQADDPAFRQQSYLVSSRWHPEVEPLSPQHGEWVFRLQCSSCHTRHGYRQIASRTEDWTGAFGFKWMKTMHKQGVMPPFTGDEQDRAALTSYLLSLSGQAVPVVDVMAAVEAERAEEKSKAAGTTTADRSDEEVAP
jgi:cytochrome bd ubiquinol oxidase subunit I